MDFHSVGDGKWAIWVLKFTVLGVLLFVLMRADAAQAYDPDAPFFNRGTFEMAVDENSAEGSIVGKIYSYMRSGRERIR